MIVLATVYGGMHFFIDDVAGVLLALLAVTLGQLTVMARLTPWRSRPTARACSARGSSGALQRR